LVWTFTHHLRGKITVATVAVISGAATAECNEEQSRIADIKDDVNINAFNAT